ncbi:right-handed parallel beta-helix repeat-containing protein [Candidatus Micrarchaeota archaeon]|nr:right-handed parallel beta-helix repeat-containing protein [Candidatus Micrarchaeota archaeon]
MKNQTLLLDPNFISLNETALGQMNKSANITINQSGCLSPSVVQVYRAEGFPTSRSEIFSTGSPYTPNTVSCLDVNTVKFEIASFSGYTSNSSAITECFLADTPNTEYYIAGNLVGNRSDGICINITASNVTIKCNGYNISATHDNTMGIYSSGTTNVTIRDCYVRDYRGNIYLTGTINATVYNNTMDNSSYTDLTIMDSYYSYVDKNNMSTPQKYTFFLSSESAVVDHFYHNITRDNYIYGGKRIYYYFLNKTGDGYTGNPASDAGCIYAVNTSSSILFENLTLDGRPYMGFVGVASQNARVNNITINMTGMGMIPYLTSNYNITNVDIYNTQESESFAFASYDSELINGLRIFNQQGNSYAISGFAPLAPYTMRNVEVYNCSRMVYLSSLPVNFSNVTFGYNQSLGKLHYHFLNATNITVDNTTLLLQPDFISLDENVLYEMNRSANITINHSECISPYVVDVIRADGFPTSRSYIISSGSSYNPNTVACLDLNTAKFEVASFSGFTTKDKSKKECFPAEADNTVYYITDNLVGNQSTGICIRVRAKNVTIMCNGYNVSATHPDTYGIYVNISDNVTIRDCNIRDYAYNIYLTDSNTSTLYNNTMLNASQAEVQFVESPDIYMDQNNMSQPQKFSLIINHNTPEYYYNSNITRDNYLYGGKKVYYYNNSMTGDGYTGDPLSDAGAVLISGTDNMEVKNLLLDGKANFGLWGFDSDNVTVSNITINNSGNSLLYYMTSNYSVSNVTIYNSKWDAFNFYSLDTELINGLNIFNTASGFYSINNFGSSGHTAYNVGVYNSTHPLRTSAALINFTNITFGFNQHVGKLQYHFLNVSDVDVQNTVNIYLHPEFVSLNETSLSQMNKSANITLYQVNCTSPAAVSVVRAEGFPTSKAQILSEGTEYTPASKTCLNATKIQFEVYSFSGYTGNLTEGITDCFTADTANTIYTLTANLTGNKTDRACITIAADNVTINCSGFEILGDTYTGADIYGIYSTNRKDFTIQDCVIHNYTYGVYSWSVNNSNFLRNTVYNNSEANIRTASTSPAGFNLLENNTLYDSKYGYYFGGANNTVYNNTIYDISSYAVYLVNADNNTIYNNTIHTASRGVFFTTGSEDNLAHHNLIHGSAYGFFSNANSYRNNVSYNTIENISTSGFLVGSNYQYIENNIFRNNTYGVYSSGNGHFAYIFNNSVYDSGSNDGVYIANCQNVSIISNTLSGLTNGINIGSAIFNLTISNNTVYSGSKGILVSSSENSTFTGNILYNNAWGMYFSGGNYNNINGNNVTNNSIAGILLNSTPSNNVLYGNRVCFNTLDIDNDNSTNTGDQDRCDSWNWNSWSESGHPGCTYSCYETWHIFFGNLSGALKLSNNSQTYLYSWQWSGNATVYVYNIDTTPSWSSMFALGRNITGGVSGGDFESLDTLLGTADLYDSINKTFSTDGTNPKYPKNITEWGYNVSYVPFANSTEYQSFQTGIMWDNSTDTNGHFDVTDNETVVFVSEIADNTAGRYGTYDFEFIVPGTFDTYKGASGEVEIYVELK